MATVSIDIPGMRSLVSGVESAIGTIPGDKGVVGSNLSRVWLSTQPVAPADDVSAWLSSQVVGLRRRLAMAVAIEASTPGVQSFVQFDESSISTKTPDEAKKLAREVADALRDGGTDVDPDILKALADNKVDPYFASELGKNLSIEELDHIVDSWGQYRGVVAQDSFNPDKLTEYDEKYRQLLDGLGQSIGTATQQTGTDLRLPSDYTDKWLHAMTDLQNMGGDASPGQSSRLGLILAHGTFSTDFTTKITRGLVQYEKDCDWPGMWNQDAHPAVGAGSRGAVPPGGGDAYDPLASALSMVGRNGEAATQLFGTGDTTTIPVDGKDTQVNALLKYMLSDRAWPTDDGDSLKHAIAAGMTPTLGGSSFSMDVATDAQAILDYKVKQLEDKGDDGGWFSDIGHLVLDGLGLIPVVGEPFDGINAIWYYAQGNVIDGSLSAASCIPVLGWAAVGGKWTRKGLKVAELAGKVGKDGKLLDESLDSFKLLAKADNIEPGVFKFDDLAAFNRAANNPHPGVVYQYKDMRWATNDAGHTSLVHGKLKLEPGGRDPKVQRDIGNGPGSKDSDVGFHLIGDALGGPTNKLNVLPGNGKPIDDGLANLNQGAYATMERSMRNALKEGKNVEFELTPVYRDPGSVRPDRFDVKTIVDGKQTTYRFKNK